VTYDQGLLLPGIECSVADPMLQALIRWHANIHVQAFPSHQAQPWTQHILQAPQPSAVPGGSQSPHPSVENDSAWQMLSNDRKLWNPDAPEPVGPDGGSTLMDFTLRRDNKTYCRFPTQNGYCNCPNVKKERLLHHIRNEHLRFFPFVCGGMCRSQTWYVVRRHRCYYSENIPLQRAALC